MYLVLGSQSEQGGARRAPTKQVNRNNRMVGAPLAPEPFKVSSKVWDYSIGVKKVSLCARLHMEWP